VSIEYILELAKKNRLDDCKERQRLVDRTPESDLLTVRVLTDRNCTREGILVGDVTASGDISRFQGVGNWGGSITTGPTIIVLGSALAFSDRKSER
jgi:hypothetical protein